MRKWVHWMREYHKQVLLGLKFLLSRGLPLVLVSAATAGVFAGMLANIGASAWEGVVFTDELNGVVEAASFYQCDVARDIDICGAALNAGNRVVGRAQAAAFCVELVVFAEGAYSSKGHFGSLGTDCTICRNAHVFSECLDSLKVGFGCRSFQHVVEQ